MFKPPGAAFRLKFWSMSAVSIAAPALKRLRKKVQTCLACPSMNYVHVLGPANGPADAEVMFIGEAPGRLGAARTGVPFTSDQSGLRFQRLLKAAGFRREGVFLTNALLCNPLRDGRNRPPRHREVANCSRWLKAQIDLVRPRLVVTLGGVALDALRLIEGHPYALRRDVGRAVRWYGRTLVPLYHPSPRTAGRRPFQEQLEDFRRLGGRVGVTL
jgi:DNA polymerase